MNCTGCNSLQIKKDREDLDDALTYNVKHVLIIGDKKFSLQLIDPIELPDQICLFLVCMSPETPSEHSWASSSRKIASVFFSLVTKGRYKAVYKLSVAGGRPIL